MDREDKLNRELRHHLAQLTAEYIRAGMSESEARRRARLEFGELEVIKEDCRDVRPRRWLDEILKDIQFAVRGFWCNSRFAVSAVAVIALAIGGASAVFSVVDRNLLRPLPYRSGDRLVSIGNCRASDHGWRVAVCGHLSGLALCAASGIDHRLERHNRL